MQESTLRTGGTVMKTMTSWLGVMVVSLGVLVPATWAAEPVKINSLFTYPDAYKMKVVRVEGVVRNYRMIHGIDPRAYLEGCIQEFVVDDGTGTVRASYAALCQMGPVMLKEGDQVTVEGHFLGAIDVQSVRKY
jgi:cytochrome c-type biogenesis protein CcmE